MGSWASYGFPDVSLRPVEETMAVLFDAAVERGASISHTPLGFPWFKDLDTAIYQICGSYYKYSTITSTGGTAYTFDTLLAEVCSELSCTPIPRVTDRGAGPDHMYARQRQAMLEKMRYQKTSASIPYVTYNRKYGTFHEFDDETGGTGWDGSGNNIITIQEKYAYDPDYKEYIDANYGSLSHYFAVTLEQKYADAETADASAFLAAAETSSSGTVRSNLYETAHIDTDDDDYDPGGTHGWGMPLSVENMRSVISMPSGVDFLVVGGSVTAVSKDGDTTVSIPGLANETAAIADTIVTSSYSIAPFTDAQVASQLQLIPPFLTEPTGVSPERRPYVRYLSYDLYITAWKDRYNDFTIKG